MEPSNHDNRTATDIRLVGELASSFLKEYGKKDLTRRHVLAYLKDQGRHPYLASDVIRCLKHRHDVVIADVMDEFPVRKVAASGVASLAGAHRSLIDLEIAHVREPRIASVLRRCSADLAGVIASLEDPGPRGGT